MPRNDNIITALDVGTSKVTTLVAAIQADNSVQFIGKGVAKNQFGIIAGSVVNMEATTKAINESVSEAEKISDTRIKSAVLGLSGEHISSINSHGVVTVRGKEVAATDIDRVIDQAKNVSLPGDREIVGVVVGEFVVDEQSGIKNPRGMAGKRLEVKVHIMTASKAMIQNLVKSIGDAGITVEAIVVNSIASSYAVLHEDEKQLGVALVDIGEGTTDITVYRDGNPVYTAVIPDGGKVITMDISYALRIPPTEAERIKCEKGCAIPDTVSEDDEVEVAIIGGEEKKSRKVQFLSQVLAPRVEEIMRNVKRKINNDDMKESLISSGVVLTGGTAKLRDIKILAEDILGLPVRIGRPIVSDDNLGFADVLRDPSFATAVGIIKYSVKNGKTLSKEGSGGFWDKMGEFLKKFFE